MISRFNDLNTLFEEIDTALSQKASFYIIGGAMLMYHGLKNATKDVDIIVDSKKEFFEIQDALKKLKFTSKVPTSEYKKVDLNQIFVSGERMLQDYLWVDAIVVKKDLRGKGIGTKLFTDFRKLAKKKGFKNLYLMAPKWNKQTIAFYEKNGLEKGKDFVEFSQKL